MPQKQNPLAEDLEHILAHTGTMWEELRDGRLFITGGTGFFGCWLLESFLWANEKQNLGATVVVLSRDPETFVRKAPHLARNPAVSLHQGDVRNFPFPSGEFTHIIHAATEASAKLNAEAPLLMLDTIVVGTRRALDFAVASGAKKFLLTSSGAVYGKQPSELTHIPEDYPGAPDPLDAGVAYGNGKRLAEHLCALYSKQHGLETKIARCFAFVGPHLPLDTHFAIGNFIRDALKGGSIYVNGDGSPYRSYLYAADLAIWLWTILINGDSGRAYNVGSSTDLTIAQLAATVKTALGSSSDIRIAHPAASDSPAARYVPNVDRARNELALCEYISLADAIRRTAAWYQLSTTAYLHMSIKKSHRPCPVCSTCEVEVIHHQRFILPAGHPLPASFDVVVCPTCGMTYADTAGTASDYDKYYTDYSKYADQATSTGGGGNQHDQARLAETATEIAKHIPNRSSKIVDIGCANGGLLGALKERGYSHLFGVDPSPACVENAKKQFGIPASQGWLLALPEEAKSADLAIVSHVFEHVLDLRDALARMHESLSPEGVIYVEVPDAQRYVDCLASPFQDFNTEHINHFDAASLENLFAAAGFDSLTIGTKTLQAAAGVPYPALFGFFRKRKNVLQPALHQWKRNPDFRKSMDIYIAKSRAELVAIDARLQLATSGPVIVWGTGQLTLKLLAETSLGRATIAAFTDGNPINHGKCLCDIEIIAPERLCALPPYPIVIGTLLHYLEITKRIRALGLNNPIVTLN